MIVNVKEAIAYRINMRKVPEYMFSYLSEKIFYVKKYKDSVKDRGFCFYQINLHNPKPRASGTVFAAC